MKTRDIKELHTKTTAELRTMLKELQGSLSNDRLEYAQRKLSNTSSLTNARHDIARLQTVLRMKQQEEAVVPKAEAAKGGSK